MQLLGKYDPIISQKLKDLPGNAKYTSKLVQNDILCTMADMVRQGITSEVKECGEFTVMIDESKDCRKIEQMSLVLRYFWNGCVYESFLGFLAAHDLSAEGLSNLMLGELGKLGLVYKGKLIGQGYDGASVMSGKHKGVAAIVRQTALMALHIHCHAHRLNLVLVDSVKSVPIADEFFVFLARLYVFASGSFVHDLWLSIQRDMYPGEQPKELQKLSDTRWACRYAACKTLRDRLPAIIRLLNELESGVKGSRALDARSLSLNIDARFVAMLTLMTDLLGRTHIRINVAKNPRFRKGVRKSRIRLWP